MHPNRERLMRYFLDTEFHEERYSLELISIAVVSADGRSFYAASSEYDESRAHDWLKENVLPYLPPPEFRQTRDGIAVALQDFLDPAVYGKPEFWGYYADYDWVVFCWLFGAMVDLPDGFPMYCRDLKQWADDLGNPELPRQQTTQHDALQDARYHRRIWRFLAQKAAESEAS